MNSGVQVFGHAFSFLLGRYLGVELLGQLDNVNMCVWVLKQLPSCFLELPRHCASASSAWSFRGRVLIEAGACALSRIRLRPRGLQPARLLCPWDSPGKNTGVGCHFLLQEDLPDPGIKPESPAQAIVSIMGTWSDYMITRNLFGSHIPHRCPAVFTQHLRRMPVGHVFIPSVLFFSPPSLGSSFRF